MKYPVFAIRDEKVGFMFPQCDQGERSAIRGFSFAVNNPEGIMNFSPKDYDLFRIGEFDSEKGTIEGCLPELVCSGTSVLNEK